MHPIYRTVVTLLTTERFLYIYIDIYIYIYIYSQQYIDFFRLARTISIYSSTRCRVFHNVTLFRFIKYSHFT